LQDIVNRLMNAALKYGLMVNADKTKVMMLGGRSNIALKQLNVTKLEPWFNCYT